MLRRGENVWRLALDDVIAALNCACRLAVHMHNVFVEVDLDM